MQEMEKEMMKLKEQVKRASEHGQSNALPPPTTLAPPTRTESTRLPKGGEKKRVARQAVANQKKGERAMDRGVADDIIKQRQEDEENNIVTEEYSRLRIK